MSKFQYKDKFCLQGAYIDCEVLGVFPGGQQRTLQIKENSYRLLMNGVEVDISETNLELLIKACNKKPEEVSEMPQDKSQAENKAADTDKPKKKRGRPRKA